MIFKPLSTCTGLLILVLLAILNTWASAQTSQDPLLVEGQVLLADGEGEQGRIQVGVFGQKNLVRANANGYFTLRVMVLPVRIFAFADGYKLADTIVQSIGQRVVIFLQPFSNELSSVTVEAQREKAFGVSRLSPIENFGLYEAKKSEVIRPQEVSANLSTNNPRQLYARVPGLNIWESDGAGLQLGIGGRGLSPNRTSNFNTRQNGYDIAADALGYPESYYTPPAEATEQIEITRGASALQYGTQFGGMVNFKIRQGPEDSPFQLQLRQSVGSWQFFNSFVSAGGTVASGKVNYFAFFQNKHGNGWRPNSGFEYNMGYAQTELRLKNWKIRPELTVMRYLAQQPGGLTDALFNRDPRQSIRDRNYFRVDWLLPALTAEYTFSPRTAITFRNFGLSARRLAVGNLGQINRVDFGGPRDLVDSKFLNVGNESRLLHRFAFGNQTGTGLFGIRAYRGHADFRQGLGSAGADANFNFLNPDSVENSDFIFPSLNLATFAEFILPITARFNLVPGFRYEYIQTGSQGYYTRRVTDAAGNIIVADQIADNRDLDRTVMLAAIGASYKLDKANRHELYGNFSQNYRAINFTDLRVNNPNIRVDSALKDERGFSADIGIRSLKSTGIVNYDLSFFWLEYANKIGLVLLEDPRLFVDYRFRTNVSRARNIGFESFAELSLSRLRALLSPARAEPKANVALFANVAAINARYISTEVSAYQNKEVELVPPLTVRTGISVAFSKLKFAFTHHYTARQYSDATNAIRSASAVNGLIPAYTVADLTASVILPYGFTLEGSVNNVFNQAYFTRRADFYPGPGIIPADARAFYLTLDWRFKARTK